MSERASLHRNGGGKLLDSRGGAGGDCYIDKESRLEDRSFVSYRSSIIKSIIKNTSIGFSEISDSVIVDSHIVGAIVTESALEDVIIRGAASRKAEIDRVSLSGDVVVEGCRVRDFELHGPHLLHTNWDRAPRVHLLETESGLRMGLSECGQEDRFHAGCCCRPWREWDQKEDLLRRLFVNKQGWPLDLFNSIRGIFAQWR